MRITNTISGGEKVDSVAKEAKTINSLGRLTAVSIIITFGVVMSQFVLRPYLSASKQLSDTNNAISILSDSGPEIDQLNRALNKSGDVHELINNLLPLSINVDDILGALSSISQDTNVRLEMLTPQEVIEFKRFRKLQFDLKLAGDFLDVYSVIRQMESIPQLNRVENLTITQRSSDSDCKAFLQMALYFAPLENG